MSEPKFLCLECEEVFSDSDLREIGPPLPKEQRAITTPEVVCPNCLDGDSLWLLSDLRKYAEEHVA